MDYAHPEYAEAVARYAHAFLAAKTEQERADARADFDAELILLRVYGPRDGARTRAADPVAERILAARYGERVH